MIKKTAITLAVFIVLVILGTLLYYNRMTTRAIPDYTGRLVFKGLEEPVEIYRDKYAVPHIFAKNEADLYRATGYLIAEDRLWQMDLLRRVTTGRLSEIFGKDLVQVDQLMRALKITDKSIKILAKSNPDILTDLESFSRGVNQFIKDHEHKLPVEFSILGYKPEPWQPVYSVNLIGYMAWDLTMPYSVETVLNKIRDKVTPEQYAELIPDVMKQTTTVYPAESLSARDADVIGTSLLASMDKLSQWGVQSFQGSNNWAISGSKSATGAPIFCNDMHLGLNAPGLWYQIHQVVEGKLNVTGVLLPGQPFVIAGHNADIAWGMTNVDVDDMDFYREKFDDKGESYLYDDYWYPVERQEETIRIKGGTDTTVVNLFTQRGPIISSFKDFRDEMISMTWTGNLMSNEIRTVYLLNRAKNWDDFRDAIQTFRAVSQNIDYADRFGNIGLYNCAGIPVRPAGMTGIDIYPGWTSDYNWRGILPFEKQLFSFNPSSGYVSSANNKTAVNDYPYPVSHWFALPYRIDRIRELLEASNSISVDDMKKIQSDEKSLFVGEIKPLLLNGMKGKKALSDQGRAMLRRLKKWDDTMTVESPEAAVFELFYVNFIQNMLQDELGEKLYREYSKTSVLSRYFLNNLMQNGASAYADDISTPDVKETLSDQIIKSYKQAIALMIQDHSNNIDNWHWGDIHQLTLKHPLGSVKILDRLFHFNYGPIPAPGNATTVAPMAYKLSDPFDVNHGPSQRHIYTPDNWDNSFSVIPTGECGVPNSPHYCDQTEMYMKFQYHPDYFSREKVIENAKYKQELLPARLGI